MSTLFELQKNFLTSLLVEDEPASLRPSSRFSVYARAYRIRLKDSLTEDFPETLEMLPDPETVLEEYLRAHPSTFWTLGEFAKFFPAFLRERFPGNTELSFSARREWARWVASSVGDPEIPPAPNPDGELVVLLNPSLQIVSEGEKNVLVFFAGGELREEEVHREVVDILEWFYEEWAVSELHLSEADLISFLSQWSRAGVIIGFRKKATTER